MPHILRATSVAILTAALLGATAVAATAVDRRPMAASYVVAVVPVEQRCGPNALTIGFEGAGVGTHLGRMTGSGSNCTEFDLATGQVAMWDGEITYIAADGSTLLTRYEGVQQAPVDGAATVATTEIVVGGTGRFDGAAGEFTGSGVIDFTTGLFTGRIDGWISY